MHSFIVVSFIVIFHPRSKRDIVIIIVRSAICELRRLSYYIEIDRQFTPAIESVGFSKSVENKSSVNINSSLAGCFQSHNVLDLT